MRNAEYPLSPSLSGPLCPGVVALDRVLYMGKIVFMLNWIVWNRTVLTFNCSKQKLYLYETGLFEILFSVQWHKRVDTPENKTVNWKFVYEVDIYSLFGWFGVLQHTMRKTSFKTRQTRNI